MSSSRSERFSFYLIRVAIVLFCVMIIFAFLYSPYVNDCFKKKDSLTIYTWADMFDVSAIADFERQTNTKINLIYYDNCEELVTKLEISKGRGYDLLLLADCNIGDLIKMDMLAPLDKAQLNCWSEIEPLLLNRSYDQGNIYSVPYSWDVYGLGINIEKFDYQIPSNSWGLIFREQQGVYNIGMMEDGLSAVVIAAQYLYGNVYELNSSQMAEIKNLLISQKGGIEAYTSIRADYLLSSGVSPVVVSQAACIHRIMANDDKIRFLLPQEGGFVSTENFVIMKNSLKHDLAYKFINFIYQKEMVNKYVAKTMFLPARKDVLDSMNLDYLGGKDHLLASTHFGKLAFFKYIVPREEITKLWIEVKAS